MKCPICKQGICECPHSRDHMIDNLRERLERLENPAPQPVCSTCGFDKDAHSLTLERAQRAACVCLDPQIGTTDAEEVRRLRQELATMREQGGKLVEMIDDWLGPMSGIAWKEKWRKTPYRQDAWRVMAEAAHAIFDTPKTEGGGK